jgi:hypothetical protein
MSAAPTVTLLDGTAVPSDSEAWRHECEARHILALPTLERRRALLAGIEDKRGAAAAQALRSTIEQLWKARTAS